MLYEVITDQERLHLLRAHGVGLVELGVQSMDDRLLRLAGRGHDAGDTIRAATLIRAAGLQVGMQLIRITSYNVC